MGLGMSMAKGIDNRSCSICTHTCALAHMTAIMSFDV